MMNLILHFCYFANAPKHYIFKLMVNFSINDSGNMKQVQKIQNYLCLEAQVQRHNKWMTRSQDQSFLFSDGVSHTATTHDVRLLHDLHCKTLVSSIWRFLLNQYHFPESSFTQNSDWVKTVYRNFWFNSSSTCLCLTCNTII